MCMIHFSVFIAGIRLAIYHTILEFLRFYQLTTGLKKVWLMI
ncbi:hypothetical protein AtNW77_Chr3g0196271 [Arabidopsis thaliana]